MAPTTQTRRRDSETAKDRSQRGIQRECRDGGRHGGRMPERRDRAYEDEAPYVFLDTVKEVVLDVKSAHHDAEIDLHEYAAMQAVGQGAAG